MTSPHFISSQDFARELLATLRKLTPEQKADFRLTLYLQASVRLTKKPAEPHALESPQ